jgi:hypothetical protein
MFQIKAVDLPMSAPNSLLEPLAGLKKIDNVFLLHILKDYIVPVRTKTGSKFTLQGSVQTPPPQIPNLIEISSIIVEIKAMI